jgi:hypothetical protein
MKRILAILLICMLGACAEYNPNISYYPNGKETYQSDLQECRDKAKPSNGAETSILMGGLIGLAIHDVANPGSNDFESSTTTINKCLTKKGYDIVGK